MHPHLRPLLVALTSSFALQNFAAAALTTPRAIHSKDTMIISNIRASPDGFERPVIAVNGHHPALLIKAKKGDEFELTVANHLTEETMLRQTSIHWHGIFQHKSSWADGPEGVTQRPVAQFDNSFTYKFNAGNETGTYWYHSHFETQYCDGLRGPLVIYDDNDPYRNDYDVDNEDTIITLADWYHLQAPSINITIAPPVNATLINGKGRQPVKPDSPLAIVNVKQGKRYRFRILSSSCDPNYNFSIDGHDLTVIEADGQLTRKLVVQRLQIFAGQRYSVILHANRPKGNYWIRAEPNFGVGLNGTSGTKANGVNSAILRYYGANDEEPKDRPFTNPIDLKEFNLHALLNPSPPGRNQPADKTFFFNITFNGGRWWMNQTAEGTPIGSWHSPHTDSKGPVLLQILNGVKPEKLVPKDSIFHVKRNQVIEITLPAFTIGPHPFHLHGHAFSVIQSAGSPNKNYIDPVRRDVVSIGDPDRKENVTIRFVTDNPGPWFFHCHIEFHLSGGLGAVFVEDQKDIKSSDRAPPPSWSELCPTFDALPTNATFVSTVATPSAPTAPTNIPF
uniref:Laccase n=1 Tax=Coprinopsis cinerea TaxID=5346 RepID=A9XCN9_COPCI|nr:laccase [Coprinopsis cinerea]